MAIHPAAAIGAVHLTVSNLERSVEFYQDRLGFAAHRRDTGVAALGSGTADLLVLHESAAAPRVARTAGLYHFAILVPSRLALARSLARLAELRTPMQGFSDHLVSEAIYLADPDGIGIEIYRDRPREEWPYVNGQLQMATDPLDVESLLREAQADASPWAGVPQGTRIGHVHLQVSFIEDAEAFYTNVLGFELTARYGASAIFVSAGGYHHHVAANTWAGVGAPRAPRGAIGLKHFEVQLPDRKALDDVAARMSANGIEIAVSDRAIEVSDPSGNAIRLLSGPA